ncbi:late control protein [Chryseobacterium sp. 09-1422]|uniref:Late control protein n=1 Tax=Chryseobacterium kimseyorum TaxID=2984028 RepID=A0ABT3HYR4_9FLAO|nr:late control protein [Chryseobacterium kimseyorum]MCW3168906.1 late control protein [Chryseobacterium kimseyorum]
MFILKGTIKVGEFTFHSISDVEITKSVDELVDTAVFKIPSRFKIRENGELKFTEEALKVGDKVSITLGYEKKYEGVEFTGYVASIGSKIPLEIKCEDSMWLLRRKNITKAFGKTTLKEILQEVVYGTEIKLSDKIPHLAIDKFIIKNQNGTQVLQYLKENYPVVAFIDDDQKLYVGLQQLTNIGQEAIYDINYNLVENNLEYLSADQRRVKVRYEARDKANKVIRVEIGDYDGELFEVKLNNISDEKTLRTLAENALVQRKYSGFEGSVKSFLIPFATRGMAAKIKDRDHLNREGKYFINKVVTSFGTDGARRDVHISNRL